MRTESPVIATDRPPAQTAHDGGRLVTLHVWELASRRSLPGMFAASALTPLRRPRGAAFVKLLGTSNGETFAPRDVTLRRWVQVTEWYDAMAAAAWESSPVARRRAAAASAALRLDLRPVRSRGRWSGREPFQPAADTDISTGAGDSEGAMLVLTRARLRPSRSARFRAAVPGVVADLPRGGALLLAMAVGEAPIGLAGTVTLWRSAAAMHDFARGSAAHRAAIRDTPRLRWYSEELFARFAVERATGALPEFDPAVLS